MKPCVFLKVVFNLALEKFLINLLYNKQNSLLILFNLFVCFFVFLGFSYTFKYIYFYFPDRKIISLCLRFLSILLLLQLICYVYTVFIVAHLPNISSNILHIILIVTKIFEDLMLTFIKIYFVFNCKSMFIG